MVINNPSAIGQGMLSGGIISGAQNAAQQNSIYNASMQNAQVAKNYKNASFNKRIFVGNLEVVQVANGYVINIGTKEGYEYATHIAHTIVEVNEIIAAAMVAFQLESK